MVTIQSRSGNHQALLVVGEESGFRPASCVWLWGLSMGSDTAFPGWALGGSCPARHRRGAETVHRGLWRGVSPSHGLGPPSRLLCVRVCILSLRAPCGDLLVGASPQAFLRETSLLRGLAETLSGPLLPCPFPPPSPLRVGPPRGGRRLWFGPPPG